MKVLVVIGNKSEDIETSVCTDIFVRANLDVTLATIETSETTKLARGLIIKPDICIKDCYKNMYDAIVFPGGEGCFQNELVQYLVKSHIEKDHIVAAICASPAAFSKHGFFKGKHITCYPSCVSMLSKECHHSSQKVVVDGKLITSQGPYTAFDFALKIVEILCGKHIEHQVAKEVLFH